MLDVVNDIHINCFSGKELKTLIENLLEILVVNKEDK